MKSSIIATVLFFSAAPVFAQTSNDATFLSAIGQRDEEQAVVNNIAQQRAQRELDRQEDMADESAQLDMQMKRARAAHADDFAKAELKRENAQTDVIQSTADANRNYSKQKPAATTIIVPRCGYWGC